MTARWRNDIVVSHIVRSDTSHVTQATDVTRHSRITQQLVPSTTALSFVCCSQFTCKKKVAHDFRYDPRILVSLTLYFPLMNKLHQLEFCAQKYQSFLLQGQSHDLDVVHLQFSVVTLLCSY